ncbi:DUF7344 domain-containing protein [Haladaptatus sp. NG-SE-30]
MGNRLPSNNETTASNTNEAAASNPDKSSFHDAVQTNGLETLLDVPPELHAALANESRQAVLAYLDSTGGRVSVPELTEHLVTTDVEPDRRSARIALHHTHLPKLDDTDLIEWRRNGMVSLTVE